MGTDRYRRNRVELQIAAREMRKEPTEAEAVLWEALRGRRLDGIRFRRQHPVNRFILDFYCPIAKLAIELDGEIHTSTPSATPSAPRRSKPAAIA